MKEYLTEFASKAIDKTLKAGATEVDVLAGESDDLSVSVRFGEVEAIENDHSSEYGIRAFVGKQHATVSSSDFGDDALDKVIERVVAMAKNAPADPKSALAEKELLAKNPPELDLYDSTKLSVDGLLETAKQVEAAALANKQITNSEGAEANGGSDRYVIATSKGLMQEFQTSSFSTSVSVLAGKDTNMQRDGEWDWKRHINDLKTPQQIGEEAARKTVAKLNPQKLGSEKLPLIFDQDTASSLLGNFASAIKGSAIARGTSFLKEQMDKQIFSNNIQIFDNPHIKRGAGSKPFDAEGVANKKIQIVQDGVLQNWLLDLRSAAKLGLKTNGRASRGIGGQPAPNSTNFYMKNGKVNKNDLIGGIKKGIYITEAFGMGINIVTGDYSQGAGGFMIENGKITHAVSEITIAGQLLAMFKNLTPANDLEMRFATNAPTLLVEGMTVAGS